LAPQALLLVHSWLGVPNSFGTISPPQWWKLHSLDFGAGDISCDVLWTLEGEVAEKSDTFSWRIMEKLMLLSVRSPLRTGHV